MTIAIGTQPGPGEPAQAFTTAVSSEISLAYAAEWHSEVLNPLIALGVDFIEPIATGSGSISITTPLGEAVSWQNYLDRSDKALMPGAESFERAFVIESFNRDMGIAGEIDAALQVSTLFEPMLHRHGRLAVGDTALQIAVPNLTALGWQQILEFRDHPGCQEARQMLLTFEQTAAEEP